MISVVKNNKCIAIYMYSYAVCLAMISIFFTVSVATLTGPKLIMKNEK